MAILGDDTMILFNSAVTDSGECSIREHQLILLSNLATKLSPT